MNGAGITIESDGVDETIRVRRYIEKILAALAKDGARPRRADAFVRLKRVDRAHGNKYEVTVRLVIDGRTYEATDSTLNVYAALDIVRLKLARALQADAR